MEKANAPFGVTDMDAGRVVVDNAILRDHGVVTSAEYAALEARLAEVEARLSSAEDLLSNIGVMAQATSDDFNQLVRTKVHVSLDNNGKIRADLFRP